TGRLNVDGMNIISNDGSNKLNRSRKARVSYKEIGRRFSRNAETDLVCRLLLEKKKNKKKPAQTAPALRRRQSAQLITTPHTTTALSLLLRSRALLTRISALAPPRCSSLFFSSMTPPPPRSSLFPYTTLFRSTGRLNVDGMNIISNDGSNKLNRSRKARVSYK